MKWMSALVFLLMMVNVLVAQELTAFQVAPPPTVDGQINDTTWTKALTLRLNHRLGDGEPQAKTTVKFCFGSQHIFVLFICEEPTPQAMARYINQNDGEVWTDDCVEIFLAPDPNEPASYYHIVVNSLGVVRDEFWQDGRDDVSWDSKARVGINVESDQWVAEIAIPLRSLNRVPMLSDVWRVNFARQRYTVSPPELSTWQPCKIGFHEPQNFGSLRLDKLVALHLVRQISATVVQQEANRLKDLLRTWQKRLPKNLQTSIGKRTASTLSELQGRLIAKDLENLWTQVKSLQEKLPQLEAKVMRARVAEQVGRTYVVFAVSPMLKLRPEQIPAGEPISQRNPITIFAARGEGESAQIVVAAFEQTLKNVKVSASPLVGPKGNLIFPEIRLVGYVPIQKPTPGGFGTVGRYPDPLLPLRNFDVLAGECQSVWLTVLVPKDVEPGEYEGAVTIEPQNAERTIAPIRLRVYNVTLPTQSFLKTCVLIWDYKARQVYGDAWTPELSRRFYELCLRYRFTPPPPLPWDKVFVKQPDGSWAANWDGFDREVEAWMSKGATAFSIGGILSWGTKPPPENEKVDVATKLRLLGEHLKRKGWSERFYFYVFDEPSTAEFVNIESLCRFVHEHAPNLNVLLTAGYGATGPFRTHAPTPDGAAYRALAGFINIWVPHIDCFDEPFLQERKKAGDQVWMYVCISTVGKTYPDIWRIDWTGVSHRAVGWWLWRYGCDGFLYWCVNYWTDDKGKPFDLFANPVAYPGGNGDGFLFYPDPDKGEPIPSVRAEIFRNAIEDYDLLTMLRELVTSLKSDRRTAKLLTQAEQILEAINLILAPNKFIDDPTAYETQHQQILGLLENLYRIR